LEPTDVTQISEARDECQTDYLFAPFVFIDADVKYLREGRVIFSPDRTDFDPYQRIFGQVGEIFCEALETRFCADFSPFATHSATQSTKCCTKNILII